MSKKKYDLRKLPHWVKAMAKANGLNTRSPDFQVEVQNLGLERRWAYESSRAGMQQTVIRHVRYGFSDGKKSIIIEVIR